MGGEGRRREKSEGRGRGGDAVTGGERKGVRGR